MEKLQKIFSHSFIKWIFPPLKCETTLLGVVPIALVIDPYDFRCCPVVTCLVACENKGSCVELNPRGALNVGCTAVLLSL